MRKIKHEILKKQNYELNIAGRFWIIPEITFQVKDGKLFLNQEELKKWHLSAANIICSENTDLSIVEFLFLMDIAGKRQSDVAKILKIDPSTVHAWIKKGDDLSVAYSYFLKVWFWKELFEDNRTKDLGEELQNNSEYAVRKKLAEKIQAA